MQLCLTFQLFFLEKDIVFESISSAVFNKLDSDSYFTHIKNYYILWKLYYSSVSIVCALVNIKYSSLDQPDYKFSQLKKSPRWSEFWRLVCLYELLGLSN